MSDRRDWTAEVAAWRESGKTAREFCAERGYSMTRLYWWSSQLKRSGTAEENKKPIPLARVVRKRRVERLAAPAIPIVVHVGSARLEVAAGTDRAALMAVLETLAATRWGARS